MNSIVLTSYDIICFCHLRWNFVYQRPQHLLSRFGNEQRVFLVEEPVFDSTTAYNEIRPVAHSTLWIVTPHIPADQEDQKTEVLRQLVDDLIREREIRNYLAWYYSPLALAFSDHLKPEAIIYDCMDELSAFRFAPRSLKQFEALLFDKADIVFTGGQHLFEAKQHLHDNIYAFPSSIDKAHFYRARTHLSQPGDQVIIPRPRIGFYGVIDERFNTLLVSELAARNPNWHFVLVGPTAKIDPQSLPDKKNIHFTGPKDYSELPDYLAGWDVAIMPFALNESTKYISPTKTPEFLAGGKPVVSTSIRDVVCPYGDLGLVEIADTVNQFAAAIQKLLDRGVTREWLDKVDQFLENNSWDKTFSDMKALIEKTLERKAIVHPNKQQAYV